MYSTLLQAGKTTLLLLHISVHFLRLLGPTYDKGLLGLRPMLVVPGRTASRVDGSFGGA